MTPLVYAQDCAQSSTGFSGRDDHRMDSVSQQFLPRWRHRQDAHGIEQHTYCPMNASAYVRASDYGAGQWTAEVFVGLTVPSGGGLRSVLRLLRKRLEEIEATIDGGNSHGMV